jgi:thermostable 8-oxoguanine DNA glycosylase
VELCVLTASNAQYCSSVVQNELLDVMMRMLQEQIVEEVKAAKYWSLIADETMDRQKRELLTIVGNSYYP